MDTDIISSIYDFTEGIDDTEHKNSQDIWQSISLWKIKLNVA